MSQTPSCHDAVTIPCPACGRPFAPIGRRRYCCDACKAAAYRRRREIDQPIVVVARRQPRRPITVYECDGCGARALGVQRCDECGTFMRRVGLGGLCPCCDAAVGVDELVGQVSL